MELNINDLDLSLIENLKIYLTPREELSDLNNGEWKASYDAFFQEPGMNHYHLFANISKQINDKTIIDLGTYRGFSALAFSYNNSNKVSTFDLEEDYAYRHHTLFQDQKIKGKENIEYFYEDIFREDMMDDIKEKILNSNIIFMDAGDHKGKNMELFLIKLLKENNYQGLVIWDDIKLNDDMKFVWNTLKDEKIYTTDKGHWSGTGFWIPYNDKIILK
jgi:predicted O-methyltransferase YrrM